MKIPLIIIGSNSLKVGYWKVEKNTKANVEVIVPPKNIRKEKWIRSTLDFLLKIENKAKQKAPNKTERLIFIPEKFISSKLPFVTIMIIPKNPINTAKSLERFNFSFIKKEPNKIIWRGQEYWIISTSILLPSW